MSNSSTLTFHNPGEIDIRGATVAGLSAKEGDTPIGKFGTGLKYSIACILRWGGSIVIHSGAQSFNFSVEEIDFRGAKHQQIMMNGQPIGFTTHYGTNWEGWMVFRELISNARDEGGDVTQDLVLPREGSTVIVLTCAEVAAEFKNRNAIILPGDASFIESSDDMQVIEKQADWLYYRNVRVRKQISRFTWNMQAKLELTEDRSLSYTWDYMSCAAELVTSSNSTSFIRKVLRAGDAFFEHKLQGSYSPWMTTSPEFLEVATDLYRKWPEKHSYLKPIIAKHKPELLIKPAKQLTPMQQMMLAKAARLVTAMGHTITVEAVTVADLGSNILGQYDDDKVLLSPNVFDLGTKQVVSTLLEECVHRDTGKADCCYDMQTYLFNRIVSLYEEHVFGEPI